MAFTRQVTVRFDEIDRAGIVYFAHVLKYCHWTYEELMRELGGGAPLEEFFATSRWGMPLVHAEADYQAPNRLGDVLDVTLAVERLGRASVRFGYRVACAGELRARCRLVHAFVDLKRFSAIPVPAPFADGLQRLGLLPGGDPPAD